MSEYKVVQEARVSPTRCFFCMEFEGPFLDTQVEDQLFGHIYICGPVDGKRPGCIGQMARLFGSLTNQESSELKADLQEAQERIAKLEEEKTVLITYDDLIKVMGTKLKPDVKAKSA